jgi:hypothetical protein
MKNLIKFVRGIRKLNNKENTAKEIGYGAGLAIGFLLNIALQLFFLWLGLWVLNYFNWLPFVV